MERDNGFIEGWGGLTATEESGHPAWIPIAGGDTDEIGRPIGYTQMV